MATDPGLEARAGGRLSDDEGATLLAIAWRALDAHLAGAPAPERADLLPEDAPAVFAEKRGVFVTWKRGQKLRGCLGYVNGRSPLWEAVRDLAASAASRDTRFPPIEAAERPELHLSVSVLTEPVPIAADAVEIGRHGLIAKGRGHRGLLLPQVATEWGWDRATFLEHTCKKAGLPSDAWSARDVELLAFEAQVFRADA